MFVLRRAVVSYLLGFAMVASASSAWARDLRVQGEAEVQVRPDYVVLHLGVETWDRELRSARAKNDENVAAVKEVAGNWGVAAEDVVVDFAHVGIQRNRELRSAVDHYTVRRTVVLTLRDVDQFEDLLMSALEAGANYIHAVDFRTSELRKHSDEARALALRAAFEKAQDLASVGGFRVSEKPTDVFSARTEVRTWYEVSQGVPALTPAVQNVALNAVSAADGGGAQWVGPNTGVGYLSVRATLDLEFGIVE